MHKWTNKNEILRDLCEAQGDVPIDVHRTVGAEDKPPPLDIKEETEEQYFACSGEGPDGAAPDLRLIQQMLNIVRNNSVESDSDEPETPVKLTPYNPLNYQTAKPKKQPQNNQTPKTTNQVPKTAKQLSKQKKNNNVAMNSIINQTKELNPIKPDNLNTNTKTDSKIEAKDSETKNKKPAVLLEPPTNMFKKKCKVTSPSSSPSSSTSTSSNSSSNSKISSTCPKISTKASPNCSKVFVPSSSAIEYMNKLKEKAKLKEAIVEDVWSKAMKQMKEIEDKRKLELELAASAKKNRYGHGDESSDQEDGDEFEEEYERPEPYNPMDMLKLPRHRHFLDRTCVVCDVFQRRNIPLYNNGHTNN